MKHSLLRGALLGCATLFPAIGMAADPPPAPPVPANQAQPAAPGTATPTGQITVQQPAPEIRVTQPQPTVTVHQAAPEIIVRQGPPAIAVQMPQPEIIVRMPKPQVNVTTPPPQVSVNESKPQVQVEAAKPNVNVTAEKQAANVQMQEARPTVRYEETGKPQVFVKSAPGQPQIRYEEMTAAGAAQPAAGQPGAQGAEPVKVSQLQKLDAYDEKGTKLGRIDHVVQDNAGSVSVVIGESAALGSKNVMVPLSNAYMNGDRLVIRGMTDQQLKTMPKWTANDQNMKEVGADQSVPIETHA